MTLQKYRSHKIVHAGKIQGLRIWHAPARPVVSAVIVGGHEYSVPENFNARGTPEIGDYFVRYSDSDGYVSWSPAKAFEDGYTLVEDEVQEGRDWSDLSQAEKDAVIDEHKKIGGAVAHKEGVAPKEGDVTLHIEPAKMGAKPSM